MPNQLMRIAPDDPRYLAVLEKRFNKRFSARPDYVWLVGSTDDVVSAVQQAVNEGRRVVVTSGAHCLEGFVSDPDVAVCRCPARRTTARSSIIPIRTSRILRGTLPACPGPRCTTTRTIRVCSGSGRDGIRKTYSSTRCPFERNSACAVGSRSGAEWPPFHSEETQTDAAGHCASSEQPQENFFSSQTPRPSQSESWKHGTWRPGRRAQ